MKMSFEKQITELKLKQAEDIKQLILGRGTVQLQEETKTDEEVILEKLKKQFKLK